MAWRLGGKALSRGYRLEAFETISSTNSEALAWARAGDTGRLWVVAGAQTAGHGRRGRAWQTPSGNLAATLLLGAAPGAAASATLGFAAGLALESAIRACAPGIGNAAHGPEDSRVRLRLKWPNDVLVDGAKVAGILLEAITVPGGTNSVVIGIGVNVRHAPEGLPYPATSLQACGVEVTAERLFEELSDAWVEQEDLWDVGRGFPAIRNRWLDRAAGIGAPVAVRIGEDMLQGTFETIDEEGRLVVRRADGSAQSISAGEVHFGLAATAAHSHAR
jgi:BirA family biotin operon repressor/biotin-[acetyl-CoA-carboxylase] ligase